MRTFKNRQDAGRQLGDALSDLQGHGDLIVLGLPRGGVPVAHEVARQLIAPLDVFIVRKLGVPGHEELAMGAIASGDTRVFNQEVIGALGVSDDAIFKVIAKEQRELERRELIYRGTKASVDVTGKTVILVDDGVATGATMIAAVRALRALHPAMIVVAVPVAPQETCAILERLVDRFVCLMTPLYFGGVGNWYDDFSQTTDAEVTSHLAKAAAWWRGFERPKGHQRRSTDDTHAPAPEE